MQKVALLSLALLACDGSSPADAGREDRPDAHAREPERAWLRDAQGRVILLRGTNVSGESKQPPDFLPDDFATEADYLRLSRELGMNAIRYLVFWEAIEPEPGVYDDAYLSEVRTRIEAAGAAGLLVIVDMHQDVYGRGFGSDGAPAWTCDAALYASFAKDPPAEWYLGYARSEVQTCFDRLYADAVIRGAFARMWAHTAQALRGASGLFAYELLNEPHWGSSAVRDFETDLLPAAYAEWIDAIRAVDPDPYVFIEPSSIANVGLPTFLSPPDRERLVYAPHVYPPALERGSGWTGTRESLDEWLDGVWRDALRMDLPIAITELGARQDVPNALLYLEQVYGALDAAALSATQWDASRSSYGIWTEELEPSLIARAMVRPHPSRIAGVPIAFSWDAAQGVFRFEWEEDDGATGNTEITTPLLAFPSGFDAMLEGGGELEEGDGAIAIPKVGGTRRIELRRR